ncbi:patatin-domain-containing protein [Pleurotus eryngii]|uniref:Lysophospholipase NTE1 n=1 Tax=Pleurotus eryngii TaxID=5323 RepID=A0A9P6A8P1_PLEER|nr:patatin-domain-containing protein [Pleurotus eryngii]
MDAAGDVPYADRHPVVSLVSACFWVILWALSWAKALIAFATITVPKWIYAVLSWSMTLTLNIWSFAIIFVASAVALNYWIRFRYLNDYMQLKESPLGKPDTTELHPDVNTDAPLRFATLTTFYDDFLQAIRVFGFLEKPVFHELARHLQTRRLIAGDSMSLEQDKSFYCVVDGMVQVYARTGHSTVHQPGSWDEDDTNGYQLLNEVGSGGTLSSLFTILSLFTEDVKMSWQGANSANEPAAQNASTFASSSSSSTHSRARRSNSDVSQMELNLDGVKSPKPGAAQRRASVSSSASTSTVHAPGGTQRGTSHSPTLDDDDFEPVTPHASSVPLSRTQSNSPGIHRGVVVRATEDTTLAVIPAEAFRRLTKKFPKATGHIVQVILTRFSRVTFYAAHKYLGLTSEVLRTEKAINEIACHPLPPSFYEGIGLQHLRQRFDAGAFHSDCTESLLFLFKPPSTLHSSPGPMRAPVRPAGVDTRSDRDKARHLRQDSTHSSSPFPLAYRPSRHIVQAGDLHSTTGHSNGSDSYRPNRSMSVLHTPRMARMPSQNSDDDGAADPLNKSPTGFGGHKPLGTEDFDLREEVMSCIAKSIGLLQPPMSDTDSANGSPAFLPSEGGLSSTGFTSSLGSLSLLDLGGEDASVTGSSSIVSGGIGYLSGLDNEVEILFFPAGATLVKAGEMNTGLFYVIEGFLDILLPAEMSAKDAGGASGIPPQDSFKLPELPPQPRDPWGSSGPGVKPEKRQKLLFTVKPGGIAGYLASLCSTASYVDIKARTDTYVGFLPSSALERLLEKRPIVLLTLANRLISLLSPLVLHIDAALDWMQVNAGQVLWRPDDASDSFYIVINGRLRAITESDKPGKGMTIVAEYGQGDTVGELDVITSSRRRTTVHAIRDTELIRMPRTLFNAISARNPQTTAQLLRMIASRVRDELDSSTTTQARKASQAELGHNNTNLKTVAVLPVTRQIPVEAFARKLHAALEAMGATTSYLNQASVSSHLGRHAFTRMGKLKSAGWLADQEQRYRIVLYVADSPVNSSWTQTCIRQADCVMIVGMGDDPGIGEYERLLLSMKTTARKELILLHPDRSVVSGSTREWLKNRPWVHQHIHVELPGLVVSVSKTTVEPKGAGTDAVTTFRNLRDRVQSGILKYRGSSGDARPQRLPQTNDFARLARRICGKSIGLVLGGGGARGISHLGVIRALEEYGIPIDHIAGTSIGAFIGGLYAREGDILSSSGRAKQFSGRMGNIWRILSDVTYPIVAYTTGHEFNRSIYKAFYDLHIEDMWLPYFCNTTNINTSQMDIHETGYAWRFIRASMTLVGLLPPLCDNGNMLVDGGYIDNLPVSAMFSMGASAVFASDVGSIDDNSPRNFGDTVSGWWLLVNRWNPFANIKVPAITEIQSRLAYVSSVNTLEEAKITRGCFYMQVPVQDYGTLQFGKFEELQKIGYQAAMDLLSGWKAEGKLPSTMIEGENASNGSKRKGRTARRNSI